MICCNNGPVIVHPDYIRCTCIDHRLDRQCHARLQKDPLSLRCEVRDLRIFMKVGTNSMSNQLADNAIAEFLGICLDCRGDVIQMIACFCKFNTFVKALFCHIHQFLCFRGDVSYCPGAGCVGMVSFINRSRVKADDIAFL